MAEAGKVAKGAWPKEMVRRGERPGSTRPDYKWWQEVPADTTAESLRFVGYEVVSVLPASISIELARAMERTEQRIAAAARCPEQEDFYLEVMQANLELRNALIHYAGQVRE